MSADYLKHLRKGVIMKPEIKKLDSLTIYGVSGRIRPVNDNDFSGNFETVPKIWQNLRDKIKEISEDQLQIISTIGCINEEDLESELEYFAAVTGHDELDSLDLLKRSTRTGEYAEFIHKGPILNIEHTLNYIYGTWLPKSEKIRDTGPELYIYPKGYDHDSEGQELKVLIPIR